MDEFSETMLLVLLCLTVSILIYVRTRIVDRMRRDQRQRQQQDPAAADVPVDRPPPAAANGVFPLPGDPARDEWAILR